MFNDLFRIVNDIRHGGKDKKAFEGKLKGLPNDKPYIRLFSYWTDKYIEFEEQLTFAEAEKVQKALDYLEKQVRNCYSQEEIVASGIRI